MRNRDEVAIVGYASRLPGAGNVDSFWSLLEGNRSSVTWITPDRFPTQAFFHPSLNQSGRSYTFAAGLIEDVWGFDAAAFGMSPREAEQVDPQQRHLLEVTYDALGHAGIRPSTLLGSETGVYVGASSIDYGARFIADPSAADVHMMTGNTLSIIANRLSYNLDLRGPSFTIDTACSSSLVALNVAADAIRNGTVETAIVAGVNLLLSPFSFVGFSRASMLSPTGRCRPFDAAADGYVRAEGAIVVVLRSIATARKVRNRVYAAIVGGGVGQDGRTAGLSLPSADSQRHLLERVYSEFGVDPSDLAFVEAHGTGTKVGDPMEADALGKALAQRRARPLPIGSVKSNIGHLEPASGLAGVLKSILALNHGRVPATLHQQSPNPDIPFDELNLRVIDRNLRLPGRRGPLLAGVNSFGFGGTNAHVILRGEDTVVSVVHSRSDPEPPPLLLTAHSAEALPILATAYLQQWPIDARVASDFIGAAAHLRDALPHRVVVRGQTTEEIKYNVERFIHGEVGPDVLTDKALGTDLPITYLFAGNGSQWAGMGRTAWKSNRQFREALKEVDDHFTKRQDWSLVSLLFAEDLAPKLRRASYSQPLLFALQVATVRALEESGIAPTATLGHSVGEIAAAWCAGVLGLDQAIDVVIARSRHQESARGTGGMAALLLGEREARRFLETANAPGVSIAAVNSWRSVTVSGPFAAIDQLVALATGKKISARRLDLDYPFHHALINSVRAPLLRELEGLKSLPARRRFVSSVTGSFADQELLGPEHWWQNVRDPVMFEAGLSCLLNEGFRVFVEISPRPILSSYVRDVLRDANTRGTIIETLTEAEGQASAADPIRQTVSKVLLAGGRVDSNRFFGPPPMISVPLPGYPWRHAHFAVRASVEANAVFTTPAHSLLGWRLRNDSTEWFCTLDPVAFPWIADHKVGGVPVFPAAGFVEVMLAAAREAYGGVEFELRELDIVRPLVFDLATSVETLLRLAPETGIAEFLSRPRGGASDWSLNARAILLRSPADVAEAVELPTLPAGVVVVPKAKVYEISRTLGFDYGESFQRVNRVSFPDRDCAIAPLASVSNPAFAGHIIDVTGLDAAFHSLFASEEAGVSGPLTRMLPIRFSRVRAFAPGTIASHAVARTVRRSPTSIVANIDLFDATGKAILSARAVRLIEAPVTPLTDPRSLCYSIAARRLDRAGLPSSVDLALADKDAVAAKFVDTSALQSEGLLLMEAACLRMAWSALKGESKGAQADDRSPSASEEDDPEWKSFLRSALLWHLETKKLVVQREGTPVLMSRCDLPETSAVIRSLLVRHPTMTAEAAILSRLDEILPGLIAGDATARADLTSTHWRELTGASRQICLIREAVIAEAVATLERCDADRLLRIMLIGADHVTAARVLFSRFAGFEFFVTDVHQDRLDQARAVLGDDNPRVRFVSWSDIGGLPPATIDLVCAIDALSEVASLRGGLDPIIRLLRPNAPLIAGELTPSLFWDVVRGVYPQWWARSANADFPVSALLARQEWIDELQGAGFAAITADPVMAEEGVGAIIRGIACIAKEAALPLSAEPLRISWEGDDTASIGRLRNAIRLRLPAAINDQMAAHDHEAVTDVAWMVDAQLDSSDPVAILSRQLDEIASRCRRLAAKSSRLWILVDCGDATGSPLDHPVWCAITAAMRVVQNEYTSLQIRCLGMTGGVETDSLNGVIEEILTPTAEREVFFHASKRIVSRIERGWMERSVVRPHEENLALRLAVKRGANRGPLEWVTGKRTAPKTGEIEIKVAAAGLNFRDVMWNLGLLPEEALEDGYAGPTLGMECAGTVSGVGAGTEGFKIGDRVIAFVSGAFASHVVAPAFAASHFPQQISFESAATLPVAFLTAYYSLIHLGRLQRGETILVHGGAGAVGLAALQLAKHCGAKVIATAGSEEKRTLLRSLGVDLVLNSRTLAFADAVLAHTGGKGVDVVLNSLAGEAMIRSIDCLKPFGRFIELGKRDYYANTHVGLRPFRRNLTYFGVDVDQLISGDTALLRRLFDEIVELFASGELVPLPHRVYAAADVQEAFRLMQRAGHVGKIVVTPASQPTENREHVGKFRPDAVGSHVVIGGTSGFGLATAEWLVGRGARHLSLVSRSGNMSEDALAKVAILRQHGVDVEIAAVDVADAGALRDFFQTVNRRRPVKGIVHAAMVLDDRLVENMDREALETVLRPKIGGAINLEQIAASLKLDYLMLYSSATTLLGNPGQFNYVAANAFLEGLARRAQARGVPALAINWGGIADTGYLSRYIDTNASLRKRFASSLISAQQAFDGIDLAFDEDMKPATPFISIARIDWAMARRELSVTRAPIFDGVVSSTDSRLSRDSVATVEVLREMNLQDASAAVLDMVVDEIANVLRLPPKELDRHRALADIGMDSLMMLELRTKVETALQIDLPMMSLINGTTPVDVARRIAGLVIGEHRKDAVSGTLAALSGSHIAADAEAANADVREAAVRAVVERSRIMEGPL